MGGMTPSDPYRVTVVCTGNICRSPMGEFILRERFEAAGLGDRVVVDSAGTHSWEVGNPADPRTLEVLRRNGHEDLGWGEHVARRFERAWFAHTDLLLAADRGHAEALRRLAPSDADRAKVRLFRSFEPGADPDDPPWGVRLGKPAPDASRARIGELRHAYRRAILSLAGRDMDDPWYGDEDAFDQTYSEVTAAADGVVEFVRGEVERRRAS